MSPSYSTKNGVRYRFYVSSALLRGRKSAAGSIGRIAAAEIESAVLAALTKNQQQKGSDGASDPIETLERVVIARDQLLLTTVGTPERDSREIRVAWAPKTKDSATAVEGSGTSEVEHNQGLIQSIIRAHAWVQSLQGGEYDSVEQLAEANRIHPKVVRLALRLAFLSPEITSAILEGRQPAGLSLARIPKLLPLLWGQHRRLLG